MKPENKATLKEFLLELIILPLYPSLMVCISIFSFTEIIISQNMPILSKILISSTILFLFFIYALSSVRYLSSGKSNAPTWNIFFEKTDFFEVAQHVLFVLLFFLLIKYLQSLQYYGIIILFIITIIFFLPSILILMHLEKNILSALNPYSISGIIKTLNKDYVILTGYLIFSLLFVIFFRLNFSHYGPEIVNIILSTYFTLYLFITFYYLIGKTLFLNQHTLSYYGHQLLSTSPLNEQTRTLLEIASEYIKKQNFKEAILIYEKILNIDGLNIEFHQRYHELLIMSNDKKLLHNHTGHYIRKLLCRNQSLQAVSLFKKVKMIIPEFKINEPAVALSLAKVMRNLREYTLAVEVLENLHLKSPQEPAVAEAYLLLAQIFSENLNKDKNAIKILEYTLINYSNHPLKHEIKNYLDCLSKL